MYVNTISQRSEHFYFCKSAFSTGEDGTTVSYSYNGDGLLYERAEGSERTRYYYDEQAKLIAEADVSNGSPSITYTYIYDLAGRLWSRVDQATGEVQYYQFNGHGDVVGLVDSAGNQLNSYTYDIWGNPEHEEETVPNIFRYSGEYWDATTDLQYLRARWYDPNAGRFVSKDSYEGDITNPLSQNLYTYVHNNPLIYVDPSGHRMEAGGGGGGNPLYNLSFTNATDQIIAARSADKETKDKLLKQLIREYKYGFFGNDSGGMTRNQFEYLFKLATDNDRSNYQVSKWAIVQLDDYFYYGANDKTIAIAATIGSMSSGAISGTNTKNQTILWDIKTNAVAKLTYTFNNQKVTAYQDSNGYWWAKDLTGHGNSAFKVFEKKGNELHWISDADKYGNFITDKHKGQSGTTIKIK
ncbi:RHS repeat-associated core domain-containing protein [Paenibacillus woosongensis]|uniref:RHS repeat-associated core domain-containing protein n=1 Tax=Paenibacillus woosongensis TaxID=307580 RepID=A0AA95I886_9BACL|nr:RHS repeat-associated core domain-containing protein [Paenibacillus woosongensis]WHX49762.1 RHS repeat-associated core domain-containing protein [Paenibacillus woosongensis]